MQSENLRRFLLYVPAALAAAALAYGGFLYRAPADVGTLISAAAFQLRAADAIPAVDRDGRPLATRQTMIADAEAQIAQAERQAPDLAMLRELRGFLCRVKGEHRAAAAHYRAARALPDVEAQQRDVLWFNEARELRAAGALTEALNCYEQARGQVAADLRGANELESATVLHELGRTEDAVALLRQSAAARSDDGAHLVQVGRRLEQWGRTDLAEATYAQAAQAAPAAGYFRARLRLAAGDHEQALSQLEVAAQAEPAEVGRLLRKEQDRWAPVAGTPRFLAALERTQPATPAR